MTLAPIAAFTFFGLVGLLVWVVWAFLNLWIWQKAKSNGNLLMLVGAAVLAVGDLLAILSATTDTAVIALIGLIVLTIGFYVSVKPMVAAQIAALQSKVKDMTSSKPGAGGGAPPASS
jgi:hypothetical protein